MPDKLTDKEIVKALECCSTYYDVSSCKNCPLDSKCEPNILEQYALDLINRLQKENERLKTDLYLEKYTDVAKRNIKAEAYKECIEKVKSIVREMVDIMFDDNESKCRIDNCRYTSNVACGNEVCLTENRAFWNSKLNNLLKEMVGEDNESKNK